MYFKGLMECYKSAIALEEYKIVEHIENADPNISRFNLDSNNHIFSNQLWNEIVQLINKKHNVFGTETVCLAEYVMLWLETNDKSNMILKLSTVASKEFLKFIEVSIFIYFILF